MKTYRIRSDVRQTPQTETLLAGLNPQQAAAVCHGTGPAMIIAGAGTGKTNTLVHRVAWLIARENRPDQILLLTFTRKAADQMLNRVAQLVATPRPVAGGTFHATCNLILREFGGFIGYPPGFTILDQPDAQDRIDVIRSGLLKNFPKTRFPKKATLFDLFSTHRNTHTPLDELVSRDYPQFVPTLELIVKLFQDYQTMKRRFALADYDDLLFLTRDLIETVPSVRETLHNRYRHILVDEYQDTNPVQADLVEAIAGKTGNLMVVGDDAQSIYKFRGADFKNFLEFPVRFTQAAVYKLEENYRSTQSILDVANAVMAQATEKFDKVLFTRKPSGTLPAIIQAPDDSFQNQFIVSKILDLRESGVGLNQIAVLFRNARNSYSLELELNAHQIPYEKRGGNKFSESAHIRDLIAFLRLSVNPKDIVSWNRILTMVDGIGPKNADTILQQLENETDPARLQLSPRYAIQVKTMLGLVAGLATEEPLSDKIERLTGYYQPLFEKRYSEDYPKRQKDLDAFQAIASTFRDTQDFLMHLALEPVDFSQTDTLATTPDEPPLILSTIHSSKGLEWHTVILMDVLDGVLPSTFSLDDQESLDEELRLFYVAVTRAREELYLVYPAVQYHRQFNDYFSRPSRFIDSLPANLTESWVLETGDPEPPKGLTE